MKKKAKKKRPPRSAAATSAKRVAGPKRESKNASHVLREQLVELLKGGHAHVDFMGAVEAFPAAKRGAYVQGLPHTAWQLLEHLRIAQWDILEFSRNAKHVSPDFPEGYWPKTPAPQDEEQWLDSMAAFRRDLREMIRLVENPRIDLCVKIPHGQGQTILREALVLADHNSYHLGQIVDLRRALGSWLEP